MATKEFKIPAAKGDLSRPSGVEQYFSPVLHNLIALAVNGKQAHWHVRGANFVGVHELLDTIASNAGDFADAAAERIVALGLPLDARVSAVAEKGAVTSVPAGFASSDDLVHAVIADIDSLLADVRAAVDGLDGIDLTSQDVAIEIQRGLDKDRWFLVSHVAA